MRGLWSERYSSASLWFQVDDRVSIAALVTNSSCQYPGFIAGEQKAGSLATRRMIGRVSELADLFFTMSVIFILSTLNGEM